MRQPNVLIAFVDLRKFSEDKVPDVCIYPSTVIADFCADWVDAAKLVRLHIPVALAQPYKNQWSLVRSILVSVVPQAK